MRLARLGTAVALVLIAQDGVAQESCVEAPVIVALADAILAERGQLPRLQQRRFGAEAAYLAIQYGGIDDAAARAMIETLVAADVPEARELLAAWLISREGLASGLAVIDPDPLRAFATGRLSVGLAVMRADQGQSYFRLMAEALAVPDIAGMAMHPGRWSELVIIAAGQPDEAIMAMAEAAAAQGLGQHAHLLAATLQDGAAREALAAKLPPLDTRDTEAVWQIENAAGLWHGFKPVTDVEGAMGGGSFDPLLRAAWHDGPAHFGLTLVNQTGWEDEGRAVAGLFLDEVAAGRIDPVSDPEESWLFQYAAWDNEVGTEALHRALKGWDFPSHRLRHFSSRAVTSMDWMVAGEALLPVVTGATTDLPARPDLLTDEFAWNFWVGIAREIGAGSYDPEMPDPSVSVGLELLIKARQWDEVIRLTQAMDVASRMVILRDAMQRLDRDCAAWMAVPGQALLLGGEYPFRF